MTHTQVGEVAHAVDAHNLPVMAYGLRTDFQGKLFDGAQALMALADDIREMKTICHCGKKATMVLRRDEDHNPTLTGAQIQIGGNDTYEALCRSHWTKAHQEQGTKQPLCKP